MFLRCDNLAVHGETHLELRCVKPSPRRQHLTLDTHISGLLLRIHALYDPEHVAEALRRKHLNAHIAPDATANDTRHDVPTKRMLSLADAFHVRPADAAAAQYIQKATPQWRCNQHLNCISLRLEHIRNVESLRNEHICTVSDDLPV